MGLVSSPAPKPVASLLVAAQVICTAGGVVNEIDSETLADGRHNCMGCSAPCQGSALVDPVLAGTIPQGRLLIVSSVSFGGLKVNRESGPAWSRAPPLIL